MNDNAHQLRQLMLRHKLTRAEVARRLGVAESTVDTWLAPRQSAWFVEMKGRYIDHLKATLRDSV